MEGHTLEFQGSGIQPIESSRQPARSTKNNNLYHRDFLVQWKFPRAWEESEVSSLNLTITLGYQFLCALIRMQ